jgi:hypothetical protein
MGSWRLAGLMLILCCIGIALQAGARPPMTHAQATAMVTLERGCTEVVLTFPTGTPTFTVFAGISPPEALKGIWRRDPVTGQDAGFSPRAPLQLSDLTTVARLDRVRICMERAGQLTQYPPT